MATTSGQFRGRVFSNLETRYHVYKFITEDKKTINVVFKSFNIPPMSQDYTLQGKWDYSEVYGWQFYARRLETAESYRRRHAANMEQIQRELIL